MLYLNQIKKKPLEVNTYVGWYGNAKWSQLKNSIDIATYLCLTRLENVKIFIGVFEATLLKKCRLFLLYGMTLVLSKMSHITKIHNILHYYILFIMLLHTVAHLRLINIAKCLNAFGHRCTVHTYVSLEHCKVNAYLASLKNLKIPC